MKKITLLLFSLLLFANIVLANATLTLSSEPESGNNFTTDDIVELLIVVDNINNEQIDLSPLNQNFEIINQTQQVYHSIINGKSSSKIQWIVSIQAKQPGEFIIPELSIGQQKTNNLKITFKQPDTLSNTAQDIFIVVEANNQSLYVKAPLKLLVNLYVSTELTARNLQLNLPEGENFTLFKTGESDKQTFYKNKRYHLYQVEYLAFYKTSGKHLLPKFKLSGLKLKNSNEHYDRFLLYQQQWQPFNKSSIDLEVNILPNPSQFNSDDWLVADNISATQEWSTKQSTIKAGDALQRIITISGKNIPAEYLPTIIDTDVSANTNTNSNNYKIYVDKPERQNTVENGSLLSHMVQKITYIPTSGNNLSLPSETISWWNNRAQTKVDTIIEGINLTVLNTPTQKEQNWTSQNLVNESSSNNNNISNNLINNNNSLPSIETDLSQYYFISKLGLKNAEFLFYIMILICLVLFACIIILAIKIKQLRRLVYSTKQVNYEPADTYALNSKKQIISELDKQIKQLKQYAVNKDPNSCYKILSKIADIIYPNKINNIVLFNKQLPETCQKSIATLSEIRYGINKVKWDYIDFANNVIPAVEKQLEVIVNKKFNNNNIKNKVKKLPALYPEV